jgi:hypothetical protein
MSSAIPSQLLSALPFIFMTSEDNVILPSTLQSLCPPSNFQMPTKRFHKPHVEAIQRQFEEVRSMGGATIEEWMKGLEALGQRRQNDATRWDRWEIRASVVHRRTLPALDTIKASTSLHSNGSTPARFEAPESDRSPKLEAKMNGFTSTAQPTPPMLPRRTGNAKPLKPMNLPVQTNAF